ncbi:MAG TPA: SBBP repeat-containing protein [Bryobacteraceae bacterium]|jgi:uncharacterized protein (TIGR03437 family)|nr:SBBP repeat-containing protein [Bryobacteraceae bacterium]
MTPARCARFGGSKRSPGVALCTILVIAQFPTASRAQLAGSIAVRDLPQYAYGATAADANGNLYIATAGQYILPVTAGAAQTQPGCTGTIGQTAGPKIGVFPGPPICTDAYLTKLDPNGNTVYATFLGGPKSDGAGVVAVDSAGDLYAAGTTTGSFPTTANAAIPSSATSTTFAAKLNPSGSAFLYVTYLPDIVARIASIAVDGQGNAYIAGTTAANHAVVVAVSPEGATFLYTTTLAGSQKDSAEALTVDTSGDLLVIGETDSPDFPVTAAALQPHYGGNGDLFVTALDPAGNIVFSTFLGGSGNEDGAAVRTDAAGNVYVSGTTASPDFPPTSAGVPSPPPVPIWSNAAGGGFLTSLSPDGKALRYFNYVAYSSPLGGPSSMAVNTAGDVYLLGAGMAGSPVTPSAPQPCYDGASDVVLMHFSPQGQLEDSTFIGDNHASLPSNNYLPRDGSVELVSTTGGTGALPAVEQVRFGEPDWTSPACITPTTLNGATLYARGQVVAAGEVVSLVGSGIGPAAGVAYQPGPGGQAGNALGGVQVFFDGIAAPILYAQSNQVNLIVPVEMSGQTSATVTLRYQNATFGPFTQQIARFDPAIFRWNPGVSTQAAAINQDFTVNGPANPAPAGSIVAVWGTGFGPLTTPCGDGSLNVDAADYLAQGYTTAINGDDTIEVAYSGGAPLLLCGVAQINIRIPPGTPSGNYAIYPEAEYRSANLYTASTANIGATVVVK